MHAQMFTVGAGQRIDTTPPFSADGYDVEIHGPNGFYRHLAGAAAPGPEVTATPVGASRRLRLSLSNSGPAVGLTVADNRRDGLPLTVRLRQGGTITHIVGGHGDGWYDVTVTSSGDQRYLRRLAGHLEDGRSGTSDAALGG